MALNHQKKSDKEMPLIPLKNLDQYLKTFFDLLKKTQRKLRLDVLECLEAFTRRYPEQFAKQAVQIQAEISACLDENDLQQASWVLSICSNLIQASPTQAASFNETINKAIILASSELAQGALLGKLQLFFTASAEANAISTQAV